MQLREKRDTVLNCNQNLFYYYFPNTTAIIRCYDSGSYAGRPVSLAGRIFFACAFKYLTTTQISELPMCLGTQNNIHSASSSSSCIAIMNDDCINALPHATATPWRRPTKYIFHVPCKKNSALPFWQSIMAKYGQICTDKHTRQTDRRTGYIQRDIHATQKNGKQNWLDWNLTRLDSHSSLLQIFTRAIKNLTREEERGSLAKLL